MKKNVLLMISLMLGVACSDNGQNEDKSKTTEKEPHSCLCLQTYGECPLNRCNSETDYYDCCMMDGPLEGDTNIPVPESNPYIVGSEKGKYEVAVEYIYSIQRAYDSNYSEYPGYEVESVYEDQWCNWLSITVYNDWMSAYFERGVYPDFYESENGHIKLSVEENTSEEDRTAYVKVQFLLESVNLEIIQRGAGE